MVAYSFKKAFVPLIQSGTKRQTIREPRKRHAKPGERLQLYTGMRTRHCRKIITDPLCIAVESIRIEVGQKEIEEIWRNDVEVGDLDAFAWADGFLHARHMWQFWNREHGLGLFHGVLIRWEPVDA